ncbi:unnamed protein product [Chondrus crispus]|uniref:Uncharacterized protein n=1 Tax=Chondrus crispus TaxID=2769 RepID=R7QHK7_CHOCR|nr:unnamed protein product [Chondrus crispus]CDF37544.1 unnamed protein product [Chondrus crispus]|eukprot:XP_005717415.1 unnamed protein product [Chondrus crispus]
MFVYSEAWRVYVLYFGWRAWLLSSRQWHDVAAVLGVEVKNVGQRAHSTIRFPSCGRPGIEC